MRRLPRGQLYHYTGGQYTDAWELVEIPGIHPNIWDVCVVDGTSLAAVGDYGTIITYDGVTAQNQSIGFGMDLKDFSVVDRQTALVIAADGYLYQYAHGSVSRFEPLLPNRCREVLAVRPSEIYVSGISGLQRFNGFAWETVLKGPPNGPAVGSMYATKAGVLYGMLTTGDLFRLRGDHYEEIVTGARHRGAIWVMPKWCDFHRRQRVCPVTLRRH